jgi:hypothetical protein
VTEVHGKLSVNERNAVEISEGSPITWRFTVTADLDEEQLGVFFDGEGTSLFLTPDAAEVLLAGFRQALRAR